MTLKYLLDTSIVSNPVTRQPDPRVLAALEAHAQECALGAPVWHELTSGVCRLPEGKRRVALETYLRDVIRPSFPVLPYDEPAAEWHGTERARLESLGRSAPYVDGQIAAIARVRSLTLVTVNEQDFARFSGLAIENWTRDPDRRK